MVVDVFEVVVEFFEVVVDGCRWFVLLVTTVLVTTFNKYFNFYLTTFSHICI